MTTLIRFGVVATCATVALAACAPTVASLNHTGLTSPSASPTSTAPSASPTAVGLTGFQAESITAISDSDFWVLGTEDCTPTSTGCPPEILHTINAGRSFQRIPAPQMVFLEGDPLTPGQPLVFDLRFADPSDGWLFGDQVWATHDGGAHWRQINLGMMMDQLEPGGNGYAYAALENCAVSGAPCVHRLIRSRATSDTWSTIAPPGNPAGLPEIGVHADTIWAMYLNGPAPAEWISHDDGRLWTRGSMPCSNEMPGSFDPVTTSVIWAFCSTGNFGDARVSTNGGASWSTSAAAAGDSSNGATVVALSAQHAFVVDPGAGMFRVTTNGGQTFRSISQLADVRWGGFTDSEVGYVVVDEQPSGNQRLWRTVDAGASWSPVSLP